MLFCPGRIFSFIYLVISISRPCPSERLRISVTLCTDAQTLCAFIKMSFRDLLSLKAFTPSDNLSNDSFDGYFKYG